MVDAIHTEDTRSSIPGHDESNYLQALMDIKHGMSSMMVAIGQLNAKLIGRDKSAGKGNSETRLVSSEGLIDGSLTNAQLLEEKGKMDMMNAQITKLMGILHAHYQVLLENSQGQSGEGNNASGVGGESVKYDTRKMIEILQVCPFFHNYIYLHLF